MVECELRPDHILSHDLFLFQEDLVQKERKPKKPKTKIAAAKKILNKNVKINTKIVFDDEGEVRYKLFNIAFYSAEKCFGCWCMA